MSTEFGRRLKEARKKAGLTQKQLAPLAEMSQSNLSELETVAHGSSKTPHLAKVCGVNAHWLATGEGSMGGVIESGPTAVSASSNLEGAPLGAVAHQLVESLAGLPASRRKIIAGIIAGMIENGVEDGDDTLSINSLTPGLTVPMIDSGFDDFRHDQIELAKVHPDAVKILAFLELADQFHAGKLAAKRENSQKRKTTVRQSP